MALCGPGVQAATTRVPVVWPDILRMPVQKPNNLRMPVGQGGGVPPP